MANSKKVVSVDFRSGYYEMCDAMNTLHEANYHLGDETLAQQLNDLQKAADAFHKTLSDKYIWD